MCVYRVMLIALLLSLLPAVSVQDPVPQGEPSLTWDENAEEAYRRALHLWHVRGKPTEAAEILISLANSREVTQVPGQAAWVLVLGAQALAEAGRGEEASALISGIERGARGTGLEASVEAELGRLREISGVAQQNLDPAFLDTLIKMLCTTPVKDVPETNESSIFYSVSQYRRAALPYFLEIVKRWPDPPIEKWTVSRAVS